MIEPSAATSAACGQAENSKNCNAVAKPASKSKRQSTIGMASQTCSTRDQRRICEDAPELIERENAIGSPDSEHDLDMEQVTGWNTVVF